MWRRFGGKTMDRLDPRLMTRVIRVMFAHWLVLYCVESWSLSWSWRGPTFGRGSRGGAMCHRSCVRPQGFVTCWTEKERRGGGKGQVLVNEDSVLCPDPSTSWDIMPHDNKSKAGNMPLCLSNDGIWPQRPGFHLPPSADFWGTAATPQADDYDR